MFILDYVKEKKEFEQIDAKKRDKDLVNFEVVNLLDIRD
jgi:hypothetical protein